MQSTSSVTLDLARRLLADAVVGRSAIEAALVAAGRGEHFVAALLAARPELASLLERDAAERQGPAALEVVPLAAMTRRLPRRMCQRLLAVPVYREPSGVVHVAALDRADRHVAEEFARCLEGPVKLVRARAELLIAVVQDLPVSDPFSVAPRDSERAAPKHEIVGIGSWPAGPANEATRPHLGDAASTRSPSGPPIPLVRRVQSRYPATGGVRQPGRQRRPTDSGLGAPRVPDFSGETSRFAVRPATHPGLGDPRLAVESLRQEQASRVTAAARPVSRMPPPMDVARGVGREALSQAPSSRAPSIRPARRIATADPWRLRAGRSAKEVLELLASEAACAAGRVAVLAARRGGFSLIASHGLAPVSAAGATVSVARGAAGIVTAACQSGYHLGRLDSHPSDRDIAALLGLAPGDEAYAVLVKVAQRPGAVVVATGLANPFDGTQQLDRLADEAGKLLEGLLPKGN